MISPIEDTPAFRAGIKSGDLIVKIDDVATRGMPLTEGRREDARQARARTVVLTVVRKDATRRSTFTLTREEINVKSVTREDARARLRLHARHASSRTAPARTSRRR